MAKKATIEAVDGTFRDIMDNPEPFGGKVLCLEEIFDKCYLLSHEL